MLQIRFSPPADLELAGFSDELRRLRDSILSFVEQEMSTTHEVDCDTLFDPSPYSRRLNHLTFYGGSQSNFISVEGDRLRLSGSKLFLTHFAETLPFDGAPTSSGINYHVHYDPLSFSPPLDPDSAGIVLAVRQS